MTLMTGRMNIELMSMHQLTEVGYGISSSNCRLHKVHTKLLQARDYAEDDWTGHSDLQARRKRQNR